ncbi:myosin light chain kinase family member 4 [Scleropages formosus]|uniref:myosin light chain kinase family member 4 n=1 Tax=Scleropages formosus TaxID=113540 RepID=UPI0010FAB70B|nr:myosin light chain kinase family member 4 [Scleropages formosus]
MSKVNESEVASTQMKCAQEGRVQRQHSQSPQPTWVSRLKPICSHSSSLRLGKLDFFRHLERVETMRCFWELKQVHPEGDPQLKDHKAKDGKEIACLSLKSQKTQKKKPPDTTDTISLKKKALLYEEVQKLNQQNAEAGSRTDGDGDLLDFILDVPVARTQENELSASALQVEEDKGLKAIWPLESVGVEEEEEVSTESEEVEKVVIGDRMDKQKDCGPMKKALPEAKVAEKEVEPLFLESGNKSSTREAVTGSQQHFTGQVKGKEEQKRNGVEERCMKAESTVSGHTQAVKDIIENKHEDEKRDDKQLKQEYIIDCSPPPPAPFDHRIVSAMHNKISNFYTINREEILGEGRFGQVHKCTENSSGLTLAAKIIKARSQKEKEVVKNEIQVMNQLNHGNLIQLYAAYESKNDIILVMEYVDGGELFDRIIDESYNLTELDTVLFIKQISEGLRYMHQMYILHLDLKPENILCVSRATYKIKIIDFGLARRYKPRERLRVNFGTPEFLAPEVINYEFVSFPTDMWSLGVISYMLVSGLSPFLGEDDNETLNNILACQWSFEEEEFADISEEAKDFISRLLVKSKSWRMSAAEALKHPFLSDCELHYRLREKKNKCRSSHSHHTKS